jgi:hypothetical protein
MGLVGLEQMLGGLAAMIKLCAFRDNRLQVWERKFGRVEIGIMSPFFPHSSQIPGDFFGGVGEAGLDRAWDVHFRTLRRFSGSIPEALLSL